MAREMPSTTKSSAMRFDDESDDGDDVARGGQSSKTVAEPTNRPRDTSRLFVKDYQPIRFYILDTDVARSIVVELERLIRDCGGEVAHKPPPEGYILVDPRTEDGVEYISSRSTPTRRVVSFQFVRECIIRGRLVPYLDSTLFIKQDKPVKFHLHKSLDEAETEKLRGAIMLGGGDPDATLDEADALIHASHWDDKQLVARKHKNIVLFETSRWLNACISRKRFSLGDQVGRLPKQRVGGQPGRKPGAPRTEFTKKDDEYLIAWMAHYFGTSMKGRSGNRPYQDLVNSPRYTAWSQRHSWQSWRERYKNRKAHFDPLIVAHVAMYKNKKREPSPEIVLTSSAGEGGDSDDDVPPSDRELRSKRKARDTGGVSGSGSKTASTSDTRPKKKAKIVSPHDDDDEEDDEDFRIKVSASQRPLLPLRRPSPPPASPPPASPPPASPPPASPPPASPPPASPPPASPPPTADEIVPQPEHEQSAQSNDGNISDSQDDSQGPTQRIPGILEAAISGLDTEGLMDRHKAELAAFQAFQAQPTGGEVDEDEDEEDFDDPDVDVEGVTQAEPPFQPVPFDSQYQDEEPDEADDADETEMESIEGHLAQIAGELGVELAQVKSLYNHAITSGRNQKEALEWLLQSFKEVKQSVKGKGRAK